MRSTALVGNGVKVCKNQPVKAETVIDVGPLAIQVCSLDPHVKLSIGHTIAGPQRKIHFRLKYFILTRVANITIGAQKAMSRQLFA